MRLVLDTNVVASAFLWNGPPRTLLQMQHRADVSLFTSVPLLDELTEILSRSKFRKKIAASLLSVEQIVGLYSQVASVVRPVETLRITRDPDDDVVIGTGLAANARLIVSGDNDLLTLGIYRDCRIVKVSKALRLLDAGMNAGWDND